VAKEEQPPGLFVPKLTFFMIEGVGIEGAEEFLYAAQAKGTSIANSIGPALYCSRVERA
jgi:hypothetical protein